MWKLEGEGRRVVRDLMSFFELLLYNRNIILYILILTFISISTVITIRQYIFMVKMNNENIFFGNANNKAFS